MVVLLAAIGIFGIVYNREPDMDALYAAAVKDAATAESDEIEPLVELTQEDALTTWDDQGRVLLLSWHDSPQQYPQEKEIVLSDGEIWTFTDKEIAAWYKANNSEADFTLRLEQLIGLPPESGYTHVSAFWVNPDDVLRPAYVTDIAKQMQLDFPEETDAEFKEWFEGNREFSYEISAYPWTRLGYTYDWADNGTEYGMTEFLIEKDASVQVVFTKTTAEFLKWIRQ